MVGTAVIERAGGKMVGCKVAVGIAVTASTICCVGVGVGVMVGASVGIAHTVPRSGR